MSLKSRIVGSTRDGSAKELLMSEEGAVCVIALPYPPLVASKTIPFRQHLTDDGLPADGSNEDMQVVGTLAAPLDFFVEAHATRDRYITTLNFVIADATATLEKFGTITALTNGCRLKFDHALSGVIDVHDALKSNFDFVRLSGGQPSFGTAADAFRAKNVVSTSEAYLCILDLRMFSPGLGIKLDAGSTQRLTLQVRDDTTGVDGFDCIAYGFDRFA